MEPKQHQPMIYYGPKRGWFQQIDLVNSVFGENDIVWWKQADPPEQQPGANINEGQCDWGYQGPSGGPVLVVQYTTYLNERYGQFIFPASFLDDGEYQIECTIVNRDNPPVTQSGVWTVTVQKT